MEEVKLSRTVAVPGMKADYEAFGMLIESSATRGTYAVSGGGSQKIEGDALQFILAASGRSDPNTIGLEDTVNVYRT